MSYQHIFRYALLPDQASSAYSCPRRDHDVSSRLTSHAPARRRTERTLTPTRETETAPLIEPNVSQPDEPTLTPVPARVKYTHSEIQRFEDYQAQVFRASFPPSDT